MISEAEFSVTIHVSASVTLTVTVSVPQKYPAVPAKIRLASESISKRALEVLESWVASLVGRAQGKPMLVPVLDWLQVCVGWSMDVFLYDLCAYVCSWLCWIGCRCVWVGVWMCFCMIRVRMYARGCA